MPIHRNTTEVLQRCSDLRASHAPLRTEIACRSALGISYANGRMWNRIERTAYDQIDEYSLDEDYNPKSQEIRVVDNRIAPLLRRLAASTNPTRIEAAVSAPKHLRGIEDSKVARVSQNALNGLDESAGYTLSAREASYHRWQTGSSLLTTTLSRKGQKVSVDVATHPDGSPIEVNDQWIRWRPRTLTDLIWDPANLSADLRNHSVLLLEDVLTVRQFTQLYGPPSDFNINEKTLPEIGELSPYMIHAAGIDGSSIFSGYARNSKEKGLRVITLMESDPRDPNDWSEMYLIIDTTPSGGANEPVSGTVINIDNPKTIYGHHGRNIFKLDGFVTGDSVWSWGIPHVLMAQNDIINIMRSIQLQQLTAAVFGQWMIDTRSTNADTFVNGLAGGVGGILKWDSGGDKLSRPPQWITPQAMNMEFVPLIGDVALSMDGQVHVSPLNKGVGKTHVPQAVTAQLLQESAVVIDNIIQADKSTYSDALKVTLGTIRMSMETPNRMLARLRDDYGFTQSDLQMLMKLDPKRISLDVNVREESIISRSVSERTEMLNGAFDRALITPEELVLEITDGLERPITGAHEREIQFIKTLVVGIADGQQFQGFPSMNTGYFELISKTAIHGLDLTEPESLQRLARLELAIAVQRQIALEQAQQMAGLEQGASQGAAPQQNESGSFSSLPPAQGPPESINPVSSPTGASGGLALGLPAATA